MESTFMIQGQASQGSTIGTVFILGRPVPNTDPPKGKYVMVTAAHVLEEMLGDNAIIHHGVK